MRALGDRFRAALTDDIAALQQLGNGAEDEAASAFILHRIAGRAGTFGFPDLSERATAMETMIIDGEYGGKAFVGALQGLLAALP